MGKNRLLVVTFFVVALGLFGPTCNAGNADICKVYKGLQDWAQSADAYQDPNYDPIVNAVQKWMPRLQRLCNEQPTVDTIRYGAAVDWIAEADKVGEGLAKIAANALMREKLSGNEHQLNAVLVVSSAELQTYLNGIRSQTYQAFSGKFDRFKSYWSRDASGGFFVYSYDRITIQWKVGEKSFSGIAKFGHPLEISLPPGNYKFTFESQDYQTFSRTITVMDRPQMISIHLSDEADEK